MDKIGQNLKGKHPKKRQNNQQSGSRLKEKINISNISLTDAFDDLNLTSKTILDDLISDDEDGTAIEDRNDNSVQSKLPVHDQEENFQDTSERTK